MEQITFMSDRKNESNEHDCYRTVSNKPYATALRLPDAFDTVKTMAIVKHCTSYPHSQFASDQIPLLTGENIDEKEVNDGTVRRQFLFDDVHFLVDYFTNDT
jgi:hypothetical protein